MNFKFTLLAFFFALASYDIMAQPEGSALEFEKTTHDFGEIEQNKPPSYTFVFTNTSTQPIKLTMVKPACGCTTPSYSKEAVAPGSKGEIKVQYNAAHAGDFNKSVRIEYDSLSDKGMNIFIKGKVIAPPGQELNLVNKQPQKPVINYSIPRGALSFEKMIENVQEITSETSGTVEIRFKNASDKEVRILDDVLHEPELTVVIPDRLLKPGQESKITITIDGRKLKASNAQGGYFSKRIVIHTDEPMEADKSMSVNGTYKRIISEAEKAASPKLVFETLEVNGGTVIEGESWVYDYKFSNQGKSALLIESAKASCGCTATKPPAGAIGAGQTSAITATFNSVGRIGKQSKEITVMSNDIESPMIKLKFTVEVVKDPFHSGTMLNTNQ